MTQKTPSEVLLSILYGYIIGGKLMLQRISQLLSQKGHMELSEVMSVSLRYMPISAPFWESKAKQARSSRKQLLQSGWSALTTLLTWQKVKQLQVLMQSLIYQMGAQGRAGSVALLQMSRWISVCVYTPEEYLPCSSRTVPMEGQSQLPAFRMSNLLTTSGSMDQCSCVQAYKAQGTLVQFCPKLEVVWKKLTSKYRFVELRLYPHTQTANINIPSGDALTRLRVGSEFLMELCVQLIVVLFTVSRIMLAKAMMMVIMIRMEIMPPVNVRYQLSPQNLSI